MASETTGATGLAGRYATALFELAEENGLLDQIADELRLVSELLAESSDLTRVIRSPVIPRTEQGAAINAVLDKAGTAEMTRKFVGVLAANRRLFALPDVIDDYLSILAGHRSEMTAEVTSAAALSERQQAELVAALKNSVGGSVSVKSTVDPGLIGGLVVKLGSRMVDSSLRTKLQNLRLAMRGAG